MSFKDATVEDIIRQAPRTAGEVGIEIEMEGVNLPFTPENDPYWNCTTDGSLRGNNLEYILKKPVDRKQVHSALEHLDTLFSAFEQSGRSRLSPSDRAGVHVHINMQGCTIRHIMNFISLYFIFEDLLVHFCGDRREGNMFCLRASDAGNIIRRIVRTVKNNDWSGALGDQYRYSSVNLNALWKYNSLEFRAMRTTRDLMLIETWVNILLRLKDVAKQFKSPVNIVESISMDGSVRFAEGVFEQHYELLQMPEVNDSIMGGVRRVQLYAYLIKDHFFLIKDNEKEKEIPGAAIRRKKVRRNVNEDFNLAVLRRLQNERIVAARDQRIRDHVEAVRAPQPDPVEWVMADDLFDDVEEEEV